MTVDGSGHKDGKLTEFLWLTVQLGGKQTLLSFLVAAIGGDHLILGYPFLHRFNPHIDWRRTQLLDGKIQITSSRQTSDAQKVLQTQRAAIKQCGHPTEGEALYIRSTQGIAQQFTKGGKLGEMPEEYQRHWKVFSEEESHRFPPQRSEDMKIQLKPGAPESIDCKVYPLSREDRVRLQKWLEDEQKLERIALEEAQYVAPVYFREKKLEDGTPSKEKRIIMDYRKINDHTVKDHNPLPNIQEAIERLHGKTLFSKFDIRWGYNNIRIAEEDQHKAAFKTPFGTYVPRVMYFGLSNAPPFFQRTMNRDFMGLLQQYPDDLGNYMDDWWIATTDDEEGKKRHREITHAFLDRMEECSYFLKPSKCQFETNSIKILGWIVGGGGVRIDPAKIAGLSEWPRELKTVKQVRQVLGLLGYQRLFIRGFAQIAKPLHDLTKKDVPFLWTQECRSALDQLITQVTKDPVLYHPDPAKQYELFVDASTFALGAVLAQRDDDGKLHAVYYLSKALIAAEWNYTIADKEFLAIIEALKRVWHLVKDSPHKLVIHTDHDNLRYYRQPQKLNRRVARYLSTLADFDYELRHIARTRNWADALSRRPDHDDGKGDNEKMTALPEEVFVRAATLTELDQEVRQQQRKTQTLMKEWKKDYPIYQTDEEVWMYKEALVVPCPEEVRQQVFQAYHDAPTAGHPGIWKMQVALGRDYWWPSMRQEVKSYVQGCLKCQATKTITHRNEPPLIPITPTSTVPFGTIAVDFITKLPKSGECDTILTITDHDCTKAVILVPCKEAMSTEEFLELYRERAFPYTGIPKKLISDRDVRFTSDMFKELCDQLAIKHNMSTAYHPQTDGQSERTNQNVETILRIFCNQAQDNWREWLPVVQYILNARPSAMTKQSPYELWMGTVPRTHQPARPSKLVQFEGRKQQLFQARKEANDAILAAQELLRRKAKYHEYEKGDRVWLEGRNLRTTHPTHKLRDKRFGPFPVEEVLGEVNYRLKLPGHWKIHNVFHAAVLHPCRQTNMNPNQYEEPPPDLIEGQAEYEVENILASRRSGRGKILQYLVQWKGYSPAHNSWEPASGIHASRLVDEFHSQNPHAAHQCGAYKVESNHVSMRREQNALISPISIPRSSIQEEFSAQKPKGHVMDIHCGRVRSVISPLTSPPIVLASPPSVVAPPVSTLVQEFSLPISTSPSSSGAVTTQLVEQLSSPVM